jgi:hypothetical protein
VRGYAEMFTAAGYVLTPRGARQLVGDLEAVHTRLQAYATAGLDEIALLPTTASDQHGEHTLTALAPSARV